MINYLQERIVNSSFIENVEDSLIESFKSRYELTFFVNTGSFYNRDHVVNLSNIFSDMGVKSVDIFDFSIVSTIMVVGLKDKVDADLVSLTLNFDNCAVLRC